VLLALALILGAVAGADAEEVVLSVAISMKEAVEELGRTFARGRPGLVLRYNVGASGDLQKQIEGGAPVDVFIAAAARQMDELEQKRLVVASSRRTFARNVLVVVKPSDSRIDLATSADLLAPAVGRLVVGNPRTVPAGEYAAESLRALGLWSRLTPKLVFAENVRQALEYVARGEVDAGVVYATDVAARRARVTEAFRLPEDTYRPIVYPAAVVTASRHGAVGLAFIQLLVSPEGQAVLARLGFQPPPMSRRAPAGPGRGRARGGVGGHVGAPHVDG
jgi:molybdate transport system substrate-binding protein